MAILIKGMKMPDSCGECPLHDGEYGWCNANTDIVMSFDERPRSCPIIEEVKQDDVEKLKQRIKELENKLDEIYQDKINETCKQIEKLKVTLNISENIPANCMNCSNHLSNGGTGICNCNCRSNS